MISELSKNEIAQAVADVLDALARAFGGKSQYSMADVGRALAGQANNGPLWGVPLELLAAEAATQIDEMWEGCIPHPEQGEEILTAANKYFAELRNNVILPSGGPYPLRPFEGPRVEG